VVLDWSRAIGFGTLVRRLEVTAIVSRDVEGIWSSYCHLRKFIELHDHHLDGLLLLCQDLIAQLLVTRQDSQTLKDPKLMRITKSSLGSDSGRHRLTAELAVLRRNWIGGAPCLQIELHSIIDNGLCQGDIALPESSILAVLS
jgi:hypothetical protein